MPIDINRRQALRMLSGALALPLFPAALASSDKNKINMGVIPATGERIPVIGMGTWRTFNVGRDPVLRRDRTQVLKVFFDYGGRVIDSSPMYGSSADVLGYALNQLDTPPDLFAADKVWTRDGDATREQTREQKQRWDIQQFDLMQIHNLLSWRDHLAALKEMKQEGRIRYLGITTSHGRRHQDLADIMASEPLDFVQLTYNITHREVERELLPIAQEKGIAIIANRPFDGGYLIKRLKRNETVPEWAAAEMGCNTWADFLLKFIVSHPAVTCAIPATTQKAHMKENMEAAYGQMPNARQRQRMIRHMESL